MRCGQAPSIPAISAAMAPLSGAAGTAISLTVRLIRVDAFLPSGLKSDRKGVLCPGTCLQHFSIRSQQLQIAMHAVSACQRQHLGVPNSKVATIFTHWSECHERTVLCRCKQERGTITPSEQKV